MNNKNKYQTLVRFIRQARVYHKYLGIFLAVLLLVSAVTGLLLGWKKEAGWIQPPSQRGSAQTLVDWLPLQELADHASRALVQAHPNQRDNSIDRMDVRPDKGMVKVRFEEDYWEVQLDGATGAVLSIARRNSDFIEQIHDGSIISDSFKLGAMNVLGLGLTLILLTGFWLWYGPRLMRRRRK